MIIGVLAILKSGGAYVPLDPTYPKERLISILEDARPLVDNTGLAILKEAKLNQPCQKDHGDEAPIVLIDINERPRTNPEVDGLTSRYLAYVIYTSGSTGRSKGVMIEHQGVVNHTRCRLEEYGGGLHLLLDDIRRDSDQLWNFLQDHSITHASLTPVILQSFKDLPQLRTPLQLSLVGELSPPSLLRELQPLLPNESSIVNEYGPTEATVVATTWMSPMDFNGHIVPIGRPIANKQIYILDIHGEPVPLGAQGELYINRPELTAKAFLQDPFAGDQDARMYKIGDLVRYLPDGNVVFLGRNDHQVKRPVAYVVAKPDDHLVHSLKTHLILRLPDYMIPAAIVRLDDLPLSTNGKLDRRQLPLPDAGSFVYEDYEAPQGVIEIALINIWMELLNIDKIGRHDNFFMLGGHSLLAVRMITNIHSMLGFKITLQAVFAAPTIAELSLRLLSTGSSQEDAFDVLLPIKPQGSRSPLFCIHPGFGLSWGYVGLSRFMHPEQPLYGLQVRGFFDNEKPAATVEDMALDYINQIRQIQAHGPYCLLGYSFGGMVAHTMAAYLEQQGERVALLAIMDSFPSVTPPVTDEHETNRDIIQRLLGYNDEEGIPDVAKSFWEKAPEIGDWIGGLMTKYSPQSYSGNLVLFCATKQEHESRKPLSPADWKPYVEGEIEAYDIDCLHDDMEMPEHLVKIGAVLAQKLDEIHTSGVTEE
ncbi:hypothetical protein BGZ65_006419 [Modicella reniformis]|uniref:Carrier domain-containing protein n=1 Tax=Modicella reniformis TaxID=1440133 RepID=A0A9P6INU4_9FUNG|nr:hypothetical protein BGZ65_006419 [Modicella reniformis]